MGTGAPKNLQPKRGERPAQGFGGSALEATVFTSLPPSCVTWSKGPPLAQFPHLQNGYSTISQLPSGALGMNK